MIDIFMTKAESSCWGEWASDDAVLEHILHCIQTLEKNAPKIYKGV